MIKVSDIIRARATRSEKWPAFNDRTGIGSHLPIPDPAFIGPILAPEPPFPPDSSDSAAFDPGPAADK